MEVHHHPHVEKKKFKEYFLEFLMIFLAVTLGFFCGEYPRAFFGTGKGKGIHSFFNYRFQKRYCHHK